MLRRLFTSPVIPGLGSRCQSSGRRFEARQQHPTGPAVPQVIGRLLELFPAGKDKYPVSKVPASTWAASLPDDVQEVLASHGGLAKFVSNQPNFFKVTKENSCVVISLGELGRGLLATKKYKEEQKAKTSTQRRY